MMPISLDWCSYVTYTTSAELFPDTNPDIKLVIYELLVEPHGCETITVILLYQRIILTCNVILTFLTMEMRLITLQKEVVRIHQTPFLMWDMFRWLENGLGGIGTVIVHGLLTMCFILTQEWPETPQWFLEDDDIEI